MSPVIFLRGDSDPRQHGGDLVKLDQFLRPLLRLLVVVRLGQQHQVPGGGARHAPAATPALLRHLAKAGEQSGRQPPPGAHWPIAHHNVERAHWPSAHHTTECCMCFTVEKGIRSTGLGTRPNPQA